MSEPGRQARRERHQSALRSSRETAARATQPTESMRTTAASQRSRLSGARPASPPGGRVRLHRLHPWLYPPGDLPLLASLPPGPAPVALLCGVCDEVLVVGLYPHELASAIRCSACLYVNTAAPPT